MISRTIQFFQENPYFDHNNLPGLPEPIDKLAVEFSNLDAVGLNYVMGLAGVKYLPSVYYKVRMFPFRSETIQQQVTAATGYKLPAAPEESHGGAVVCWLRLSVCRVLWLVRSARCFFLVV